MSSSGYRVSDHHPFVFIPSRNYFSMTDVKRFDDDDDGDMKTIDADGKIVGSSDEDSDVDDTPDETIEMPNGMPDIWLVKVRCIVLE